MKTKQIIALILAAGLLMAVIAGCDATIGPDENPREPMTIEVPTVPEELEHLLERDIEDLSDEERQELAEAMGLDPDTMEMTMPEGVTEAPEETTQPPPTTMPAGREVEQDEVYPMLREMFDILATGRHYMRGRMSMPDEVGFGSIPFAMAVDGNRMMNEMTMDWRAIMQAMGDGQRDFGASRVRAAAVDTLIGRRIRMVMTPDNSFIAFPDRNAFIPASAFAEEMGDEMFGMDEFPEFDFGDGDIPDDVRSERVTVGNREYVSATWREGTETVRYFFYDGQLRRQEIQTAEGTMIMEIDQFHGNPDNRLFTSQGMSVMPIARIINVLS